MSRSKCESWRGNRTDHRGFKVPTIANPPYLSCDDCMTVTEYVICKSERHCADMRVWQSCSDNCTKSKERANCCRRSPRWHRFSVPQPQAKVAQEFRATTLLAGQFCPMSPQIQP